MHRFQIVMALALAVSLSSSVARAQTSEEDVQKALDQLGTLLGLPMVTSDDLERQVEEIGELRFRRSVPINFMSREELARYIRDLFEEEYPKEFAEKEERALRAFGLLDEDDDLRTIREGVLNENIAGFYDEREGVKKLFAISSGQSLNLMNQLVLSHELRHAVQDQHVRIGEKLAVESDYDDRRLAALCLFEGDASILMERYLTAGVTQNMPEMEGLFDMFSQSMSGEEIASMFAGPALQGAPPVVQDQLISPYFDGRRLAAAIYEKGGFALLNRMLENPPRSMEQVLHPEKYLSARDEPIEVDMPETRGATVDFEGRLGELLIRTMLRQGPQASDAVEAAAGWGGDAYAVMPSGRRYALVWRTRWDTQKDAREFEDAFRAYVAQEFPGEKTRLERTGSEVLFERIGFE